MMMMMMMMMMMTLIMIMIIIHIIVRNDNGSEALVAEVAEALRASGLVDDVPYAFFGHSLGSLVALETARPLASEITASVFGSCRQWSILSRLEARTEYVRTRRIFIGTHGVIVALALAVGSLPSASSLASDAEAPGRTDDSWPSSAHPHLCQRPRLAEHGSGDRRKSSAHRPPGGAGRQDFRAAFRIAAESARTAPGRGGVPPRAY